MDVIPIVDEGLGNSAYLVDLGDGRALAVDASRDLRALRAAAEAPRSDGGLRRRHPPARRLPLRRAPACRQPTARRCWRRRPASGEFAAPRTGRRRRGRPGRACGCGRSRPRGTPTSTWPSRSLDGRRDAGGVHRRLPDRRLGGPHRPGRRRSGPRSWPAPSTGRCAASPTARMTTSRSGPPTAPDRSARRPRAPSAPPPSAPSGPPTRCCRAETEDAFVDAAARLAGQLSRPTSAGSAEINRRGPALRPGRRSWRRLPGSRRGGPAARRRRRSSSMSARSADFAAGHVPGAISIPLRPVFATWLGWLVARGRPR